MRIMIFWGKEEKLLDEIIPRPKGKIYFHLFKNRVKELEEIRDKLKSK